MPALSRRRFLQTTATCALATLLPPRQARANPLGLPLGLQLYSVREQLEADYAGTLRQLGALGYREVEAAGFNGHAPVEVKALMEAAGLRCVSAHYPASQLQPNLPAILQFHKDLGTAPFIICSSPGFRHPPSGKAQAAELTLDDWKWNAEQFNQWGKQVKDAGFQFGYHNHTREFVPQNGIVPYDQLLQNTDPKLVIMEMDCGWVTVGGGSPEHYLRNYADRIKMLHVKDFAAAPGRISASNPPPAAELGRGTANYREIFAAVKPGAIEHIFVEQEAYPDLPWVEALRADAEYLQKMRA